MKTLLTAAGLLLCWQSGFAQNLPENEFSTTIVSSIQDEKFDTSAFQAENRSEGINQKRIKSRKSAPDVEPILASAPDANMLRKNYLIKTYGYTNGTLISQGKIWTGMTIKMALESKGIPVFTSRSVGGWGITERWVYADVYLFFENGVLTAWNKQITKNPDNAIAKDSPQRP